MVAIAAGFTLREQSLKQSGDSMGAYNLLTFGGFIMVLKRSHYEMAALLFIILLATFCGGLVHGDEHSSEVLISAQEGVFKFRDWKGASLSVHYVLPETVANIDRNTPVLFVMTGRGRNADDYRDQWKDLALQYGFIVLAPEFKWADYPDEVSYDMGNVFTFKDRLSVPKTNELKRNSEDLWAFSAIEPIFDAVRDSLSLGVTEYSMYGHSSGAGFVHRFIYYKPQSRLGHAVAANGAWYLLPIGKMDYPYGLKGSKISKSMLNRAFRRDLTIMFGQDDIGPRKQFHANTPQADSQGPHVVSRAMNFLLVTILVAEQLDMTLNWRLQSVPNVGHSNTKMAPWAVEYLFPELQKN